MSLVSDIITGAYRESNVTSLASPTPNANQIAEALTLVNRMVSATYGYEVGNPLVDWPVGYQQDWDLIPNWCSDDWVRLDSNIRLLALIDTPQTLWMPHEPTDGARILLADPQGLLPTAPITLNAHTRAIEGQIEITISETGEYAWFYRGDLGQWVRLGPITDITAQFPFPDEFDDYFITYLAMRLNPRYGRAMDPSTQGQMERALGKLRARYRQKISMPCDDGVLAVTQGYGRFRTYGWPTRAVRGRARWMG
jgi:hypothetical protein